MPSPSAVRRPRALRRRKQRRDERHIDEIGDEARGRAGAEIERRAPAVRAMPSVVVLTRSAGIGKRRGPARPSGGLNAAPNAWRRASARLDGAIDDDDALDAARDETVDHGARRAAGAEHDRLSSASRSQPGAQASRLSKNPSTSVLVERSTPPSSHNVLAAPTARARSSGCDSASAASLCGTVTLAPT